MDLYKKEISVFFSTIIGPLTIGFFLLVNGLLLWSEISTLNILANSYASMDIFFSLAPLLFLLLIPAISMRAFSEEYNNGTIETLVTKPISIYKIITTKFLAVMTLVIISIVPTSFYVITIYSIGETTGNLDLAGITGSYIGLIMLSSVFSSIGVFASCISNNQIIAFILGVIFSAIFYFGFDILSKIQILQPIDIILQKSGISYHYKIMSKGLIQGSDIVYFISVCLLFLKLSEIIITSKK